MAELDEARDERLAAAAVGKRPHERLAEPTGEGGAEHVGVVWLDLAGVDALAQRAGERVAVAAAEA